MLDQKLQPAAQQPLVRSLGVVGVLFLTLSVTTPASSVFVIVPGMLQIAGTGAIWATIIAGIVCIATAYIYAELSSAWPVAGGEYVMVARTLEPLAGFVMLGINVFNNLIFLSAALTLIAWSTWSDIDEGRPAIVATLVQIVVAGAYYRFVLRRRNWTARLPVEP